MRKSTTGPDYGYINQEHKQGMGYVSEMTVDTKHGIILGVDFFPANERESNKVLKHIEEFRIIPVLI